MVPRPNERPAFAGPDSGPEAPFPLRLEGPVIKGFGRGSKELGIPTANIPISGLSIAGHEDLESGIYFGWAGLCTEGIADATENNTNQMNSSSTSSNTVDMDAADTGASAAEVAETQRRAALAAGQDAGASAPAPAQDQSPSEKKKPLHGEVYPMVMSIGWNPFYKNSVRSAEIHLCHSFTKDFYGAHLRLLILGYVRPELDYVSKEALIEDIRTDIRVAERSLSEREAYARYKGEEWLREF